MYVRDRAKTAVTLLRCCAPHHLVVRNEELGVGN